MKTADYNNLALQLSPMLNALSHPARLQIMLHLSKYNGCQAGSISGRLPLAKSTVSEHLSKLKEAGLITCVADGTCSNYQISNAGFELVKESFNRFLNIVEQNRVKRGECCPAQQESPQAFSEIGE